jgi:hypothetical protein
MLSLQRQHRGGVAGVKSDTPRARFRASCCYQSTNITQLCQLRYFRADGVRARVCLFVIIALQPLALPASTASSHTFPRPALNDGAGVLVASGNMPS